MSAGADHLAHTDRVDTDPTLDARGVVSILRRSFTYVWPVKHLFFLKFFLMAGSIVPMIVAPWPVKILIDHVVLQTPLEETTIRFPPFMSPFVQAMTGADPATLLISTVSFLAALLIVFGGAGERFTAAFLAQGQDTATRSENLISAGWSLAGGLWGLIDLLCNIRLVQGVTNGLRTHLFRRLMRLPMRTLDDQRIGDGIYRTMYDAPAVQGICFDLTLTPAIAILSTIASITVMHYSFGLILPELVWLGLATLPLALLLTVPLAGAARSASQAARGSGSTTTNQIEANMANIEAVQTHGRQDDERASFGAASAQSFRQFRRVVAVNIGIEIASALALGMVALVVFMRVTDKIIAAELSPGDFMVVFGLFGAVAGAAIGMGRLWVDLQNNAAGVRRVLFYIDLPNETDASGVPVGDIGTGVRFDDVSFTYPDGREALRDISFTAGVGESVALVGPTGAGKTTLAYMLPGFLRPTRGRVLIDDVDLAQADLDSVRALSTFVFQEHYLLDDTIAANLRLGSPDASEDDIARALRLAGAAPFIDELPAGVETRLGRGGGKLSVGQKQRLSIARGLLRDSAILVLDEPTAALDPETERSLVSGLNEIKAGRVVFVIAHRLSTIRAADRILFMDEGRIVEQGSHDALMAMEGGSYRAFVELQSG